MNKTHLDIQFCGKLLQPLQPLLITLIPYAAHHHQLDSFFTLSHLGMFLQQNRKGLQLLFMILLRTELRERHKFPLPTSFRRGGGEGEGE